MDKLTVIGWADYENKDFPDPDFGSDEEFEYACNAVIERIREKQLSFSGSDHQYTKHCAPVLSDHTAFRVSQRVWGKIMAEAWNATEPGSYVDWYLHSSRKTTFPGEVGECLL